MADSNDVTMPPERAARPQARGCCCRWGAAVKGEYPEFGCADCPTHQGGLGETERCKRHTREADRD